MSTFLFDSLGHFIHQSLPVRADHGDYLLCGRGCGSKFKNTAPLKRHEQVCTFTNVRATPMVSCPQVSSVKEELRFHDDRFHFCQQYWVREEKEQLHKRVCKRLFFGQLCCNVYSKDLKMLTRAYSIQHMGHFPQDGENEQNVSFFLFLKLYCDQT